MKTAPTAISATLVCVKRCRSVCLWNMLYYSKETHNIRSRPCGVVPLRAKNVTYWGQKLFHKTKIWGKPKFVFSTCLWGDHSVIVFLSIWIRVVWADFLAFSIIVHFSVNGIPGHLSEFAKAVIHWKTNVCPRSFWFPEKNMLLQF